ncbi:MAG: hypothetical protein FWE22_08055 [Firmicutes bacterium]|nr:hypothetical protein [Bacillota bacterium]
MKRFFKISLVVFFVFVVFAACFGHVEKNSVPFVPKVPHIPTTFASQVSTSAKEFSHSYELKMFNAAIENVKNHKSVIITCKGISSTKMISDLEIHSSTIINFENKEATELFRKSYSMGSGFIGSRACRAKRFYYNKNENKTYSEHTKKLSKDKSYIFENGTIVLTVSEFEDKFKRGADEFFMYIVNAETISSIEKPLEFCGKTKLYSFSFCLKPIPSSVKADLETLDTGGIKTIKQEKITITVFVDESNRLVSYETHSNFKVDTGIPIFGKQQVTSVLNQTIQYFDAHQEMPWKGK